MSATMQRASGALQMVVGKAWLSLTTWRTPSYVLIRDWRLALPNQLLTIGIVLFMALYVYLYEKEYFECVPAAGSLTFEVPERGLLKPDGSCGENGTLHFSQNWVNESCYGQKVQERVQSAAYQLADEQDKPRPTTPAEQQKHVCGASPGELGITVAQQAAFAATMASDSTILINGTAQCLGGRMLVWDLQDRVRCFRDKDRYFAMKPLPNLAHRCLSHRLLLESAKDTTTIGAPNKTELADRDVHTVMESKTCELGSIPARALLGMPANDSAALDQLPWTPATGAPACVETVESISKYKHSVSGQVDWKYIENELDAEGAANITSRVPRFIKTDCTLDAGVNVMSRTVNELVLVTYVNTTTETRVVGYENQDAAQIAWESVHYDELANVDLDNIFLPFTMVVSSELGNSLGGTRYSGNLKDMDVILYDAKGNPAPKLCHWHMFHHAIQGEFFDASGHCYGDEHWQIPCKWSRLLNKVLYGEGSKMSLRSLMRAARTPMGVPATSLDQPAAEVLGIEALDLMGLHPNATLQHTGFALLLDVSLVNTHGMIRTSAGLGRFMPTHVTAKLYSRLVPSTSLHEEVSHDEMIDGFQYKVAKTSTSLHGITINVSFQGQVCRASFINALLALPTAVSLIAVVGILMIAALPLLPGGNTYKDEIQRPLDASGQETAQAQKLESAGVMTDNVSASEHQIEEEEATSRPSILVIGSSSATPLRSVSSVDPLRASPGRRFDGL